MSKCKFTDKNISCGKSNPELRECLLCLFSGHSDITKEILKLILKERIQIKNAWKMRDYIEYLIDIDNAYLKVTKELFGEEFVNSSLNSKSEIVAYIN